MQEDKIILELPTKMVVLTLTAFDTDIDVDEVTTIQSHNRTGEIYTFPSRMNRIGNLKADMEQVVAETKLDFQIFEAKEQEKQRKALTFRSEPNTKGVVKVDKPTKDEVENAVLISPEYRVKKIHLIQVERNLKYVESLYWAARSKDEKLNVIAAKMSPEEFEKELVEGVINGILIQIKNKSII